LVSIQTQKKLLKLIEFYQPISPQAQAYRLLSNFTVNLSEGLAMESQEVTEYSHIPSSKKYYLNSNIQNAPSDGVIPASPARIVVQHKYAFRPPGGKQIKEQLPKHRKGALLWVYPHADEDSSGAPRAYRTPKLNQQSKITRSPS